MTRFVAWIVTLIGALAVAGSALAPAVAQELQETLVLPDYRVGIGDRLKISVYNADKLGGEYLVGGDGKISLPVVGRVMVGGLTLEGIAELLSTRFADGYLLNPKVTVDIAAYRPVYILGEVQRPGQYPYVEGMTIYQLVAQAGGFTYRANRRTVRLRREGDDDENKYAVVSASEIRPGDTVVILERYF
jgi:protein involved in polysaccharide export with SLBB domain